MDSERHAEIYAAWQKLIHTNAYERIRESIMPHYMRLAETGQMSEDAAIAAASKQIFQALIREASVLKDS